MKLRKVKYTKIQYSVEKRGMEILEPVSALFHQWGVYRNGMSTETTAIIELENGQVVEAQPSQIVFLDKPEGAV